MRTFQTTRVGNLALPGSPRIQSASSPGKVPVRKPLGRFHVTYLPSSNFSQKNKKARAALSCEDHLEVSSLRETPSCGGALFYWESDSLWLSLNSCCTLSEIKFFFSFLKRKDCIWDGCRAGFLNKYIFNWLVETQCSQCHLYLLK